MNDMLFQHWQDNTLWLLQRLCECAVIALIVIRLPWLRNALHQARRKWQAWLITSLFFGLLSCLGTHNGLIIDVSNHTVQDIREWSFEQRFIGFHNSLSIHQAIIGFRDTIVMAAGLLSGSWVGLAAGIIGGIDRYYFGGFVALPSALLTVLLGLFTGLIADFYSAWLRKNLWNSLVITFIGTGVHRIVIYLYSLHTPYASDLISEIAIPLFITNCLGVYVILLIMRDLEHDKLIYEANRSALLALQAQIEPHFFNNTLNNIKVLIQEKILLQQPPELAIDYIVKLAQFFNQTRLNAQTIVIPLKIELEQLQRYLDFQSLRFPDKFSFEYHVPNELLTCQLPPRSLQTLVENILLHGRQGLNRHLLIQLNVAQVGRKILVQLNDNGCGIAPERLAQLGKQEVKSKHSNGTAIYQLVTHLDAIFQGTAMLHIASILNEGTTITFTLPKEY